ncbi:MAG: GerMN domain-containing protein [Clostridia bacterium]|nr:GerMN domain-containing protein [Clostridia bacterium]
MKKCICLTLIFSLLVASGCSMPAKRSSGDTIMKSVEPLPKIQTQGDVSTKAGISGAQASESKAPVSETRSFEDKGALFVTIYYQDREGFLIPVSRTAEKQEGIARAAVSGLADNSLNREELAYYGLFPVLPKGTQILGITIREGVAYIDFDSKLLGYKDEASERRIICSVVYTLTEFRTINGVRILVNGHNPGRLKFGTDISGVLNRKNILVNAPRLNVETGSAKLDVYLIKVVNHNHSYVLPVSAQVGALNDKDIPGKIVELLARQQTGDKLFSALPAGTKLLGSSISGKTIILDFSGEIRNYGGNAAEDSIVKQLLYSMRQISGIESVRLKIEGKSDYLTEGTDISKDLKIPREINPID